jgi:hypothetical protein
MRKKLARYSRNIFFLGLGLICMLLPFQPGFMATVEILTVFFFILGFSPAKIWRGLKGKYWLIPYVLLFTAAAVWQPFSANEAEAARQTEVKLAFLIIPFLLAGSGLSGQKAERFIRIFVYGCLAATLILLAYAGMEALQTRSFKPFFYTDFSRFIHVTYFSLYLLFSAGWLLMKGLLDHLRFPIHYAAAIAVFFAGVFFCSSKIMILASVFSILFMAFYLSSKANTLYPALLLMLSALILPVLLYQFSDNFRLRVNYGMEEITKAGETTDPEKIGSTGFRMVVWKESLPVIKKNLPFGIGPGNVQNELQNIYHKYGMEAAENRKLNMHNEFLQQALGSGIFGPLLLTLIILLPWMISARPEKFAGFMFSFLVFSACLTESILERQAGTLFIALIGILIMLAYGKKTSVQKG